MSESSKIFEKLAAITASIGSIPKTNTNSFQSYRFRSVAQAMAALQPLMIKNGVVLQPAFDKVQVLEQEKGSGAIVHLSATFWCIEDGSCLTVSSVGQGSDAGDKAVAKAMACAVKYMIFTTFMIPEDGVDAEHDSPEVKPKAKPLNAMRNLGL